MSDPNSWKIKKCNYSSSPWRLVDESDQEVYHDVVFDHPDLGASRISMPVCADTKAELIEKILAAMVVSRRVLSERSQALRIIQTWVTCDDPAGELRRQAMQRIKAKCMEALQRK